MLAKFVTVTDVFTKYTEPVSELCTTAFPPKTTFPVVAVTVGTRLSRTIAFRSAMFAPLGSVVDVSALPATSVIVPAESPLAVKSDVVSPLCTVYVPVRVVPFALAVRVIVLSTEPVSKVTVKVLPEITVSDVVAVITMALPNPNVPSELLEDIVVIVGAVVSTTIAFAPAMLLLPVGKVKEVIMFPAVSAGALVSTYELTVKSALVFPAPIV